MLISLVRNALSSISRGSAIQIKAAYHEAGHQLVLHVIVKDSKKRSINQLLTQHVSSVQKINSSPILSKNLDTAHYIIKKSNGTMEVVESEDEGLKNNFGNNIIKFTMDM